MTSIRIWSAAVPLFFLFPFLQLHLLSATVGVITLKPEERQHSYEAADGYTNTPSLREREWGEQRGEGRGGGRVREREKENGEVGTGRERERESIVVCVN